MTIAQLIRWYGTGCTICCLASLFFCIIVSRWVGDFAGFGIGVALIIPAWIFMRKKEILEERIRQLKTKRY